MEKAYYIRQTPEVEKLWSLMSYVTRFCERENCWSKNYEVKGMPCSVV